nr:unnamed protein product [Leishmania braziliensis]CAJ2465485.1 unnamed protein product [Leishmania braziliensis]CAJ2466026.1 unnamed protein product [Leishmania braziliensis]CAJ2471283.1 unnamed protein product [Leishmania braziliensis]CAJ2471874.1 unnamed protein product [Leishmania braziliensis]
MWRAFIASRTHPPGTCERARILPPLRDFMAKQPTHGGEGWRVVLRRASSTPSPLNAGQLSQRNGYNLGPLVIGLRGADTPGTMCGSGRRDRILAERGPCPDSHNRPVHPALAMVYGTGLLQARRDATKARPQ